MVAVSQYVCACGSTTFIRFVGDKAIYCKKCGNAAPPNVRFRGEEGPDTIFGDRRNK